jgi:small subunit ribosomal protein S8
MMTDPISDFLTRIRNGNLARHKTVVMPSSKLKARIANLLKDEGYLADVAEEKGDHGQGKLTLTLRYDDKNNPVIDGITRISRPGLRSYVNADQLPKVRGGLGMAILSTSRGVMTDHQARKDRVGGEVICHVW